MGRRIVIEKCVSCGKEHWVWIPNEAMPHTRDQFGYLCPETKERIRCQLGDRAGLYDVPPEEDDLIGYEILVGDQP